MLTSETKRKIDSARQVLVGKVTNPISQVEQITNALIYKFMDDMDQENLEVDLKPQFFVNEYETYSWRTLMNKRLSGQDRFNLYEEATKKLSQAKHIPTLFRTIFKDARLPYNDPRTFSLFLKEINEFTYDHSEELGNTFEYLLSILGSQGDAGQFRTPRHIIDFIVKVIDPKKNESILDPACGTAGFLISSYKHIQKNHNGLDNKTGKPTNKEVHLSPEEKEQLVKSITGYDISDEMVKLALVNMYLHGFSDPQIYAYDTLSDEKRWKEQFDVVLANPPFMSPKGGIQPHKKFAIQAKRAEVLFVDYIMEHLSINGRAGIIVPEGIIFKNDKAYKQLRKKLVEDGLFAVVSLPAGVFQPYSGVKTSILFFDNQITKKNSEILFVKVENDGFDLGAQRRPIDKNNLPEALKVLQTWKIGKKTKSNLTLWKEKENITGSGDYNLTIDRYQETKPFKHQKWPIVELGKVININFGKRITKSRNIGILYPVYGGGGESFRTDNFNRENEFVISRFAMSELCVRYVSGKFWMMDSGGTIIINDEYINTVNKDFIGYLLTNLQPKIYNCARGPAQRNLDIKQFKKIKIPLPPLDVQKEIVMQIEVKQNAINHAREIIKNLERERRCFGQTLKQLDDVEMVELGRIFEKVNEKINPKKEVGSFEYVGLENIKSNTGKISGKLETEISEIKSLKTKFKKEDILFGKLRPNLNKVWFADRNGICSTDIFVLRKRKENALPQIYSLILRDKEFNKEVLKGIKGAQLPRVGYDYLSKIKIPLPPISIQKQLVSEVEKEEEIITANYRLIELMEKKIEKVISEI